jgi:glutamine amidotransferase
MIAIVDYGVGNLRSIENAIKFYNATLSVDIVSDPDRLKNYSKIILPGVGAFGEAIKKVREKYFDEAIREEVRKGKYLLGICLGMQMLARKSYEYGEHKGLSLIEGEVIHFKSKVENIRVPHIGWNEVEFVQDNTILLGPNRKGSNADFYFVHSYYFSCDNPENILGLTDYGVKFASVINMNNIFGVQFHPEKSQEAGLQIIRNFINAQE